MLEFFGLFFVNNGNPALIVCTSVRRINISLNPTHVGLNDGTLVLHPGSLRVFMCRNRSSLIGLDILLKHGLLSVVSNVRQSHLEVVVHLLKVARKLAELDFIRLPFEFHVAVALGRNASHRNQELVLTLLESTSVEDVETLGNSLCRKQEF